MIKIEKTDSLVDILRKINDKNEEKIILDFPFGHPILHNYSSLKILQKTAGEKQLIISTNDKTAKKIGKNLGIHYSLSTNPNLVGHNYSFGEYLWYTIKTFFTDLRNSLLKQTKDVSFVRYQQKYASGKIGFFITFLLLSIILLFFIFYFAVNRTVIYITPEIEVKTKGHNFIFKEVPEGENLLDDTVIKLKKVQATVSLSDSFGTSGIQENDVSLSNGRVTLHNLEKEEVQLVRKTRLQSADGMVFLLETDVTIPGADLSGLQAQPGTTTTSAIARVYDINGKIIGKRGNIKTGTSFILPGLEEAERTKIYATANEDFRGGDNNITRVLSEIDIENAKGILESKLQKAALDEIKQNLKDDNEVNNVSYQILLAKDTITYSNLELNGLENIKVGQEMETFKIYGTITASAYIYNEDILIRKIQNIVDQTTLEDIESVLRIDKKSIKLIYELSRNTNNQFSTKQTVFADVFYKQNFNANTNKIERLKGTILGKNKEEAERILINNPQISNVQIKIRPFFMETISKIPGNVKIVINKK